MAEKARAIVDEGDEQRLDPLSGARDDLARAMVEVQVHQLQDVLNLVASDLALNERSGRAEDRFGAAACGSLACQAVRFQVPPHAGVGGARHRRICCGENDAQVVVQQLRAQWYPSEGTEQLVHGFSQALQKVGLPRSLMSDRGSAMLSGEFTTGLAALGILHVPTLPRSPHVNGKQENLWSRVEGRRLAMLEGETHLTLDELNLATQAWITQEYHRTVHRELGVTPLARYLAGPNVSRECPTSEALRAAFRIEVKRRQRRSDGTVSLEASASRSQRAIGT